MNTKTNDFTITGVDFTSKTKNPLTELSANSTTDKWKINVFIYLNAIIIWGKNISQNSFFHSQPRPETAIDSIYTAGSELLKSTINPTDGSEPGDPTLELHPPESTFKPPTQSETHETTQETTIQRQTTLL